MIHTIEEGTYNMRKLVLAAAAAAALSATPAFAANEARVEARGGIAFAGGAEEAFAGVAAGYDFDLGDSAFIGVEGSADKVLANGSKVLWGLGARVGAKTGDAGKLYAIGGIGFCCSTSDPFLGAGYQHKFGESLYGKIEYRRVLTNGTDLNFVGVGLGTTF
jgi:hypothetical protein